MADESTTKGAASSKRAAAADVPPVPDAPAPAPAEPDTSGWFRNTGPAPVTAMFDDHPSVRLEPGERHLLPADPQFPDLEPCDAPTTAAADTARSEP